MRNSVEIEHGWQLIKDGKSGQWEKKDHDM